MFQDHHIISDKNRLTEDHELIGLPELDLHVRSNKIFLPRDASLHPTRSIHNCRQRISVSKSLARQMDTIVEVGKRLGWNKGQYQNALKFLLKNERSILR